MRKDSVRKCWHVVALDIGIGELESLGTTVIPYCLGQQLLFSPSHSSPLKSMSKRIPASESTNREFEFDTSHNYIRCKKMSLPHPVSMGTSPPLGLHKTLAMRTNQCWTTEFFKPQELSFLYLLLSSGLTWRKTGGSWMIRTTFQRNSTRETPLPTKDGNHSFVEHLVTLVELLEEMICSLEICCFIFARSYQIWPPFPQKWLHCVGARWMMMGWIDRPMNSVMNGLKNGLAQVGNLIRIQDYLPQL